MVKPCRECAINRMVGLSKSPSLPSSGEAIPLTASVGRGVEDVLLREEHAGQPGDAALTQAINAVRARGGIAIVIAHRRSALAGLDQLLLLANGQVQRLAPRRTAILFDIVVVWACLGIVGSPWRRNWFGSTPIRVGFLVSSLFVITTPVQGPVATNATPCAVNVWVSLRRVESRTSVVPFSMALIVPCEIPETTARS